MAGVKKAATMKADISTTVELPTSGMVDIVLRGTVYSVTPELAKTLIDKGSAKLKV